MRSKPSPTKEMKMAERTYDMEDSRYLPYRFVHSPETKEIYVMAVFEYGLKVSMMFESREAFHRFLFEGDKLDHLIAEESPNKKGLKEAEDILKAKHEEG